MNNIQNYINFVLTDFSLKYLHPSIRELKRAGNFSVEVTCCKNQCFRGGQQTHYQPLANNYKAHQVDTYGYMILLIESAIES